MPIYFVDSGGNDANDGLDNVGIGLATGTWEEATLILTQNGHGYTFATGDVIYLASGTGLTPGLYEPTASDGNTITFAATSSLPGVGDGNDIAAGDDATGDWASSDGPFQTINGAEDEPVAAGDTVWIISGTDYEESVTLDVSGTITSPITYRGYTTSLGDSGRAVIDGGSARATCVNNGGGETHRVFENIELKLATADLVTNGNASYQVWKNCYFHNCVDGVVACNDHYTFERCIFKDLSGDGVYGDYCMTVVACVFDSVTGSSIIRGISVNVFGCLIYDVGVNTKAIYIEGDSTSVVGQNTLYGLKDTSDTAIYIAGAGVDQLVTFNNIITNWTAGIDCNDDCTTGFYSGFNNVLFSNTADYLVNTGATSGTFTFSGEQTADPDLGNPGSDDYTIPSGESAYDNGVTGFDADSVDSNMPIGAHTPAAGGGAGGANKRGGKQSC